MGSSVCGMEHDGYLWGDAETTYADWKGTAQLDQAGYVPSLGELVGLDESTWFIIGIDIGGGEHGHDLHVIAVPVENKWRGEGDIFPKIAAENGGEVHATDFLIHDVDPYAILRSISHMFDLRLRVARFVDDGGIPIRIVAHGDVPEQPL